MEIVFFSEGNQHTRFFEPILKQFAKQSADITLITLDREDKLIESKLISNIKIPKNNFEKINLLKNISSDYFITTTPGLGQGYFPKSKVWPSNKRPKYVYLFHSLVSPNEMYIKNSFNNFDIIFAPSDNIKNQLKYLVTKNVEIIVSGYLLFDNIKNHQTTKKTSNNILIAPTWGDGGLVNDIPNLEKLINFFNNKNYNVEVRPHPMTFKNKKLINQMNNFKLDLTPEVNNFNVYDFLVTDYSGIALEYYFFTKNPTLFIESTKKIRRKITKQESNLILIENEMRNIIGNTVKLNLDEEIILPKITDISKANNFINSFHNKESSLKVIDEFLNKNLGNQKKE